MKLSNLVIGLLVAASAVAAALAGCHPTSTSVVDPIYAGILGGLVTLASSRAQRGTLLWLAVLATAVSRNWVVVPAGIGLLVAFADALRPKPVRALGALTGALCIQAILRWPSIWFHGATALVGAAAVIPCLVGAIVVLPRTARRRVLWAGFSLVGLGAIFTLSLVGAALTSRSKVDAGITATESALQSVSSGDASGGTRQLSSARSDFSSAVRRIGAWYTAGADLVPIVAQQRYALAAGAATARDVAVAAGDQATNIDFSQLHDQDGRIDLQKVEALRQPLETVDVSLTQGSQRLDGIRSGWLVSAIAVRVDQLDQQVLKAKSSADLAIQAVGAAPSLLGGEGTRHYFVAFLDPTEMRGIGGLIVAYGQLTASNGRISLTASGDVSDLDTALLDHGGGHISGLPAYEARYGSFDPERYFQDVPYSPDLPTVTEVIQQLYQQAGNPAIDGVLLLDPRSLAGLLSFTGPIQVPVLGELNSSNAEEVLDVTQYNDFPRDDEQTARRAVLFDALTGAFGHLSDGSLPGPRILADDLGPDVKRGDLLFWSLHPQDQPLLDRLGLGGAFPSAEGKDLFAVVDQNVANNKIDAYLQRTITDQVRYDRSDGRVESTVQVVLQNQAPAGGLPEEVLGSYMNSGLPIGTNYSWLTLYSPLDLTSATVDGKPLTMAGTPELGVTAYSGYVKVAPKSTLTVTAHLSGRIDRGPYAITVFQQPTVLQDRTTVSVGAVDWRLPADRVVRKTFG